MGLGKGVHRFRSKKYLAFVRSKPCLICGNIAEAHHLTYVQPKARSLKAGDQHTVPLCHMHHMQLHDSPMREATWWACAGVNPIVWSEDTYAKWSRDNADDPEYE
jgi:hypothetical protein